MRRLLVLALALLLPAAGALAEEYAAYVYLSDGNGYNCQLINMDQYKVRMKINNDYRELPVQDVGVVIFNRGSVNFNTDFNAQYEAKPHQVYFNNGARLNGQVNGFIPGGAISLQTISGMENYYASDIARIYLNPQELFKNVRIVSGNQLEPISSQPNNQPQPQQNQQRYPAHIYLKDAGDFKCEVINIDSYKVRFTYWENNSQQFGEIALGDLGLVIFDSGKNNYPADSGRQHQASPHQVVFKNGSVLNGQLISFVPGQTLVINNSGRQENYKASDIARVYFNPVELFRNARIVSNNYIEAAQGTGGSSQQQGNNNRGGNKQQKAERLGGGEVMITFYNGNTARGIIYDARGRNLEIVMQDGRTFKLNSIYQINYEEAVHSYKEDQNLRQGGATFIYKNGAKTFGQVLDYRGKNQWELTDKRMIPARQLARIVFR